MLLALEAVRAALFDGFRPTSQGVLMVECATDRISGDNVSCEGAERWDTV